jgi:serine/threonine protein kinase
MLTALDDAPDGELRGWREEDWRALLADLPTDGATFAARFERTWDEHLVRTAALFTRLEDAELRGYVGLLVLTLQSLRHSERHRSAGGLPGHDCDAVCRPLVRDPAVREAIRRLYRPGGGEAARAEWDHIDFSTLEFHRHGTTSFILTGRPLRPRQGQLPTFALKCIVYPFLRMPTIGRATRSYAAAYDLTGQPDVQHLVHVWASDDRWILMDFVTGETLAELLARELGPPGDEVRLDLLDGLGRELFHAMAELDRCGLRHGDLSPSNIIVTTYGTFKLIDLGVNYLYTHAVTGVRGPDAGYVAPEVVAGEDATRKADLYSVGQLLVTFGGVGAEPDGVVPDPYYSDAPELARFVEDLTDRDPRHRQLIFPGGYDDLRRYFLDELAAVRVARGDRPAHPTWLRGLIDLCRPLLGMPSRQRRLWRLRRKQGVRGSRRGAHVRWLLGWSLLSAASWYLAITVVVIWWLRDLNLDWGNQAIAVLQRLTGTPSDQFPYLDSLRAADYPIPDLAGNLPVRLTALSFAIVAARYYQGLFAGITPLAAGWRAGGLTARAVTAEVFMRMGTVLPVLLILPATLVERRWWPLLTAVGMTYVFLANWSAYAFTRAALRRARLSGLSTVRGGRAAWLTSFAQWTPASLLYAVCVWVIGVLIYSGELADVYFYACGVATVNIALWYAIKLGRNLAPIRAGLTRACLAAERARHR